MAQTEKGFAMLAYVEVASDAVDFREGRNERGYWSIRRQKAFVHQGGAYPDPFEITLEEKENAYPVGKYLLAGGSFRLGKFGLELGRSVKLVPLSDAVSELSGLVKSAARPVVAA